MEVVQSGPNNTWQEEGFITFPDNSSVLTFMCPGLNGIQLASDFVDATYGTVQASPSPSFFLSFTLLPDAIHS